VTPARARGLRTKIVVEGANGPTTPAADDILRDRFILVIPDVLANAGGVTVSYFEWVQDFSSFFWTEDEINARLESIMVKAFDAIWRMAQERKVSIRTAAFIIACQRVLAAREQRGCIPDPASPAWLRPWARCH
jgi:glutamate dehydrogenase (NAD(P)+)